MRGSVVVDPGYAAIYTYARSADDEIPKLEQGQTLELEGDPWIVDKETQPPPRISQGKLIELMEERGLGPRPPAPTSSRSCTTAGTSTPSARALGDGDRDVQGVPRVRAADGDPEMTAELEHDMDQIAAGETTKDEVVTISREMLHSTTAALEDQREDFAKQIWAGMDEDKFLGPCKVCEEAGRTREDGSPNRLRIIDLKGGKRMYGCEGWNRDDPESPDSCQVSGPLPGRGYELWRLEERCSVCGERPRLTVKGFRGRPWKLCLNDDCPTMVEMREKRAERQAAREAREAASRNRGGRRQRRAGGRKGPRERQGHPERWSAPSAAQARPGHQADQARPLLQQALAPRVFVTLEGIDRSGRPPRRRCSPTLGPDTLLLRERRHAGRGAHPQLLKDPELELNIGAELLLFGAARAQLAASVIEPAKAARPRYRLRPLHRLDRRLPGGGARQLYVDAPGNEDKRLRDRRPAGRADERTGGRRMRTRADRAAPGRSPAC